MDWMVIMLFAAAAVAFVLTFWRPFKEEGAEAEEIVDAQLAEEAATSAPTKRSRAAIEHAKRMYVAGLPNGYIQKYR